MMILIKNRNTHFFLWFILLIGLSSCQAKRKSASSQQGQNEITVVTPSGAPAYPGVIYYEMPDGYVLNIFLRGDEWGHIALTEDGYLIDFNSEGFYVFVLKDDEGNKISSEIIARNPDDRTTEEWEEIGEPYQQ